MKLLDTHAFNCIVLRVKFGLTSYEDIPLALALVVRLPSVHILLVFAVENKMEIHQMDIVS